MKCADYQATDHGSRPRLKHASVHSNLSETTQRRAIMLHVNFRNTACAVHCSCDVVSLSLVNQVPDNERLWTPIRLPSSDSTLVWVVSTALGRRPGNGSEQLQAGGELNATDLAFAVGPEINAHADKIVQTGIGALIDE